jgi:hypothetical protein
MKTYKVNSTLWLFAGGTGSWHFATIPKKESDAIKVASGKRKGWGAVPVSATIGTTKWKTSIFPDSKSGCYILPVKADVRKQEGLFAGDKVSLSITI